ncbi:hypothetical protein [Formicincola oecophyllae]|uniref:hypothetical protein n=1 Tax=Formicincola oecophyllae TaxID=2558361 RepID=UPI00143CC463|nr:hypothetical protein [Formicincola oecophyllae]
MALCVVAPQPAWANDPIAAMERQIKAMQEQLHAMKARQAAENARVRAELKAQRELFEADPYVPRTRALSPHMARMMGVAPTGGAPPQDLFGLRYQRATSPGYGPGKPTTLAEQWNHLLPSRSASTPYGLVDATPPAHPDLYQPLRRGQLQIGGIRITLGGYLEAAGFWRSRTMGSDISSAWQNIPWANQPAYHMSSFNQSERQSRVSVLVEGMLTKKIEADGYFETDFQAAGSSSNSRQSSSYVNRVRQIYGELKDHEDGLYLLGGQAWSLLTMFNKGMFARDEQAPVVIEANYLPGFMWTRAPQIRLLKTFGAEERYGLAFSVENPSAIPADSAQHPASMNITDRVSGTGINNPSTWYATDPAPDLVAKAAADPGWGHYELTGVMRFMRDRTSHQGGGSNHTIIAGGGGGGMILPLMPERKFYIQLSGMVGRGIGRYGSAQLPDYTWNRAGGPLALPEASALVGIYGSPLKNLMFYGYAGAERVLSREGWESGGNPYGYGNRAYSMGGCMVELGKNCMAGANVHQVSQATGGWWWSAAHGDYGKLLVGAQYSHTWVNAFSGRGGKPRTDENMVFFSLRYMPFN